MDYQAQRMADDIDYHASPGLSQSALKAFIADPQLYRQMEDGDGVKLQI